MRTRGIHLLTVAILAALFAPRQNTFAAPLALPSSEAVLKTLRKGRPRLLLTPGRIVEIMHQAKSDTVLKAAISQVVAAADAYLRRPLKLDKHYRFRTGMNTLGMAWHLTGEKRFATRARADLLQVAALEEWTPSYFLGIAAYTTGAGIGYDWFHSVLSAEDKKAIRTAIIEKGLKSGLDAYRNKHWWTVWGFNWNQSCNSAMIIGSLAIADDEPRYAQEIIPYAVRSLPDAIRSYGPDGAWSEGASYWKYATETTLLAIEALRTALDTDYGLAKIPGLVETGQFPIFMTGPSGAYLHFSDCPGDLRRKGLPVLFWFARESKDDSLAAEQIRMIKRHGATALDVLWYHRPVRKTFQPRPLNKYFRGAMELAVFRSAWDDPEALFLSMKGGYNGESHAHMDLGSFEFEALGVRWAGDLGKVNYDLPGQWGLPRWNHYRTGPRSHNVPLLDDALQDPYGRVRFVRFKGATAAGGSDSAAGGFAIVNLSAAYTASAARARRGVMVLPGRRSALVQDEFLLQKPCQLAWGMTTSAEIRVEGGKATLCQDGKTCVLTVLEPKGAVFKVESAERKPPEKPNKGVKRLMLRMHHHAGAYRVAVLMAPDWGKPQSPPPKIKSLAEWE